MAIGLCTDIDFEREVNDIVSTSPVSISSTGSIRGRGNVKEIPPIVRKVIAAEAIEGGSIESIKEEFEISRSSISAYMNGSTSTASYNNPLPELVNHNNKVKNRIATLSRLIAKKALRHITDDKLELAKPAELAIVAKSMTAISNDMEPVTITKTAARKTIIYKPRTSEESEYEIIDVIDE